MTSAAPRLWAIGLCLAVGCSGQIGTMGSAPPAEPGQPGARSAPRPGDPPAPPSGTTAPGAAPMGGAGPVSGTMPMRRLGRAEYENTLRALFGPTTASGVTLPDDPLGE